MITQVLTLLLLSSPGEAPPANPAAKQPDPRKAEWVCERQRLTGSNARQTLCVDKRERRRMREDAERILEREQERMLSSRRDYANK